MDERDMQALMREHLRDLDWSSGVNKTALIAQVADDEALRNLIGQYVTEDTYANADAVCALIPQQAWQDAQGDHWRGGLIADAAGQPSHFRESPVGQQPPAARPPGVELHAHQIPPQERDQLLSVAVKTGSLDKGSQPMDERSRQPPEGPSRPSIATALSAVMEGFGQLYNRQPSKGLTLLLLGLSLSTLSGLNTWLFRRIFGARKARIGPERLRLPILALWAVTYSYNLWDAWRSAQAERREGG